MNIKKLLVLIVAVLTLGNLFAEENIGSWGKTGFLKVSAADCAAASAQIDMDINNVRTTLLNGGDLWWNLSDARYEIPKIDPPGSAPSVHSLFAGAIWLGGIDAGGQLKVAAQTYRQSGNDFWPGPLDDLAAISAEDCERYDRFWKVLGSDIDDLLMAIEDNAGNCISEGQVPNSILVWPARGNVNAVDASNNPLPISSAVDMAPFYDSDGDGVYNPVCGDYPVISDNCGEVYADQMIFWVYNDKGNIHTETNGQPIGVQVNALAFAFATSDEVNDMTFYRYKLLNKATTSIGKFYMAQWVDPDLGCFNNDYVGCDTSRSLGICYNGTPSDPDCASRGYGNDPPLIGIDYFEGPLADLGDGIDNDGDGIVDEGSDSTDNNGDGLIDDISEREKLGMSTFTYYNNDFSVTGNPETAVHFYGYMSGFWKDNTPFTSDQCDAYGGTTPTKYMFPGDPSKSPFPDFWSECSCGNAPADRRFLQASGPFTLDPGAVNSITVGAVWVQPADGFQCNQSTFDATIGVASDKAQALFDNCFKLVDGPDAPTLNIRELDKEIIISLVNLQSSNNFQEMYDQVDPIAKTVVIGDPTSTGDSTYTFEGYILFQLANAQVTASELSDINKSRVVAQVDIENGISKLVNFAFDQTIGADIPVLLLQGNDDGIQHSFNITDDLFATGEVSQLINHKTYYFSSIAYAYNNYKTYDPMEPSEGGQKSPFLQGRRNYRVYSAIPHIITPDREGTVLNAEYGDGVVVTRLEGEGNSGFDLELTDDSKQRVFDNGFYGPIQYEPRKGPIDVMVYDPLKLENAEFTLSFIDTNGVDFDSDIINSTATWKLDIINTTTGNTNSILSERNLGALNEQLIEDYGISISMQQVSLPGRSAQPPGEEIYSNDTFFIQANGLISAEIEFDDPEKDWLTGVQDAGTFGVFNWQRSGQYSGAEGDDNLEYFDDHYHKFPEFEDNCKNSGGCKRFWDPKSIYANVINATWSPYCLTTNKQYIGELEVFGPQGGPKYTYGPAFPWRFKSKLTDLSKFRIPWNNMDQVYSVDIVLTSDKSQWTRCVVIETGDDPSLNVGGSYKGQIRNQSSKDFDGNIIASDTGRSWFPGYAINIETGERLNILFGENSWLTGERGDDMIWNPTSTARSPLRQTLFGGGHYIYVHNSQYDEGADLQRVMLDYFNVFSGTVPPSDPILTVDTLNKYVYNKLMWTSLALLSPGYDFDRPELMPTNAKVRLRINRPYKRRVVDGSNSGLPKYFFSTEGLAADTGLLDVAQNACDLINVVPNPYYAYSSYETTQLDNIVKITNLPPNSVISIFSLNGTLIRRYDRDIDGTTSIGTSTDKVNLDNSIEWDLKNSTNIPISSGLYLIHVEAEGICERTIKWFGALRPIDLDTF